MQEDGQSINKTDMGELIRGNANDENRDGTEPRAALFPGGVVRLPCHEGMISHRNL
jgi:hypothetical protein